MEYKYLSFSAISQLIKNIKDTFAKRSEAINFICDSTEPTVQNIGDLWFIEIEEE